MDGEGTSHAEKKKLHFLIDSSRPTGEKKNECVVYRVEKRGLEARHKTIKKMPMVVCVGALQ